MRVESWADVVRLLAGGLSEGDAAAGWTDDVRNIYLDQARQFVGTRFTSSDARGLLAVGGHLHGISSGPIVTAVGEAVAGVPGEGSTQAVALAVKLAAANVRKLGFKGSQPHLERRLPAGTLFLVHFQRSVSGATGREPGFTVNLNVVSPADERRWLAAGLGRIRSSSELGVYTRLGKLAYGHDHWWHPSDEGEAARVADEVTDLIERYGLPWLEHEAARGS